MVFEMRLWKSNQDMKPTFPYNFEILFHVRKFFSPPLHVSHNLSTRLITSISFID